MLNRLSRRNLLRGGVQVAGLSVAGAALAACGTKTAKPTVAKNVVVITLRPWVTIWESDFTAIFEHYLSFFTASNPSIQVKVVPNDQNPTALIASIIAGTGPDVFHSYRPSALLEQGLLLQLDDYVKSAGIDLSIWSTQQLNRFRTSKGLFAFPAYQGTQAVAVNLDIFDAAGKAYPDPNWDYQTFSQTVNDLYEPPSGGKPARFGLTSLGSVGGSPLPREYVLQGFGASVVDPSNPTACTLDATAAIACGQWWYSMYQSGAATIRSGLNTLFDGGQTAMRITGSWELTQAATEWQNVSKWAFYPIPSFPKALTAFSTSDLYAVNVQTKHPTESLELLRWLTAEPQWQQAMMQMFLLSPGLKSLWPQWVDQIYQVDPAMKSRNLEVFTQEIQQRATYTHIAFQYQSEATYAAIAAVAKEILAGTYSVSQGFAAAASQANSMQAAYAKEAASSSTSSGSASSASSSSS